MSEPIRTARDLGAALAGAREANGLSQREMAAVLGISQRYIVEMEAGKPSLYSERLFAWLRATGLELSAAMPRPEVRIGAAPVLWPRSATPADAVALHAIDPRRGIEEYAVLAGEPDRRLLVIDEQIAWPKRRSTRLRADLGARRLGTLAGYALDGAPFVVPGPHAEAVRDALGVTTGSAFDGR